jgi:Ni,Fe-hydrogenase I cytochrome b subunit
MKKELNKTQTIILLVIFVAIGGIILYGDNTKNNFSPLDYVIKQ